MGQYQMWRAFVAGWAQLGHEIARLEVQTQMVLLVERAKTMGIDIGLGDFECSWCHRALATVIYVRGYTRGGVAPIGAADAFGIVALCDGHALETNGPEWRRLR